MYDVNICIFDSYGDVCFIDGPTPKQSYDELCDLDISDIKIYPDACQILAGNTSYTLTRDKLVQDEQLDLSLWRPNNTKNARSADN